jgi:hypothetical protein
MPIILKHATCMFKQAVREFTYVETKETFKTYSTRNSVVKR